MQRRSRHLTEPGPGLNRPAGPASATDELAPGWWDPTTGLAGERLLIEHLRRALARAQRNDTGVGVLVLDLVGSKLADVVGRSADAIEGAVRPGDVVARLERYRFALALEPIGEPRELTELAQRCRRAVREIPDADVDVTMGHTIGRTHDQAADVLVRARRAADGAARIGPGTSRNVIGAVIPHDEARHFVGAELATLLAHGRVGLDWTPLVDLDDRAPVAWEVVPTWRTGPLPGLYGTQLFDIARTVDLVEALGDHLVQRCVAAIVEWRTRRASIPPAVLLDLPSEVLVSRTVLGSLLAAAHRAGLPADLVVVKVFEEQLARSPDLERTVRWMRAEGMPVAVAGVADGLSSFRALAAANPALIELGERTTARIDDVGRSALAASVALGRELGIAVGAAGVDDAATAARLRRSGVRHARGRWAGRPVHGPTADRRVPSIRVFR